MNCLAEERFLEIFVDGGLDATRPDERAHLAVCDSCQESWATASAAAEVLMRSRPQAAGRTVRWFPLGVAAAVLLVIVGTIVFKLAPIVKPPAKTVDPIVSFLDGGPVESQQARVELLKRGRAGLLALVEARIRHKGSARIGAVRDLIYEIKATGQDPYRELEAAKGAIGVAQISLDRALKVIRSTSRLNLVLDPSIPEAVLKGNLDLFLENCSLRDILELLCKITDLDFDFRYGVWYIAPPAQLWAPAGGPPLPLENAWEGQMPEKLRTIRATMDAEGATLGTLLEYLKEITGVKVVLHASVPDPMITLKVEDLAVPHVLELLTLPRGLDLRLENGAPTIFWRKR